MMIFTWDENKRQENLRKHGLDFADAHEIWEGPMLEAVDNRHDYGETRYIGMGLMSGIEAVVVYTEQDDLIRIISLRQADSRERGRYYEQW